MEFYNIQSCYIDDKDILYFDVFIKDNLLYIIKPVYYKPRPRLEKWVIRVNGEPVKLTENKVSLDWRTETENGEPFWITKYEIKNVLDINDVSIKLKDIHETFQLVPHVEEKKLFSVSTLFKYDIEEYERWYNYYKAQGADHFYIYYNGILSDDQIKILENDDVTLINWDFRYVNFPLLQKPPEGSHYKYGHHAQPAQINHAFHLFNDHYMLFCDFDEFLEWNDGTLREMILKYSDIDVFGFRNCWAKSGFEKNTLHYDDPLEYPIRAKNIYKVESYKNSIKIHSPSITNGYNIKSDLNMYHFHKINASKRLFENKNIYPPLDYKNYKYFEW
jgi:hypothetical protein